MDVDSEFAAALYGTVSFSSLKIVAGLGLLRNLGERFHRARGKFRIGHAIVSGHGTGIQKGGQRL